MFKKIQKLTKTQKKKTNSKNILKIGQDRNCKSFTKREKINFRKCRKSCIMS